MTRKLAINGFGRIGRCIVRAMFERGIKDLELVALNDLTDAATLAHLYNYDTVHGRATHRAEARDGKLVIQGREIRVVAEKDPGKLPWKELGVDIVLECTGLFTDKEKAVAHLAAGARKVIIGAPAKGHDATIVLGVNTQDYDAAKHHVISCGSCTTNCLAPVAKVLLDGFGLERGLMTTTHSYTNDQALLDVPHRKGDLRRARAAAQNIIPASSGAAKALSEVIPSLKGKFDGQAMRVPTMDVSLVDLTFESTRPLTKDAIHAAMKAASEGAMANILGYTEEQLVSSDYLGDARSSIFDATLTQVLGERFAKVFAWYDNEWGFSNRMIELSQLVASKL
ncbi:type I glyceraldehyde-3-phosphate dehydrogenase [Myxococcus sp. K38C18041901]|uniref:type I glyceraldehyde-3-phosphate dehydrogenase n=1 Tax=Myxococcus guangdongensis TaxID=2906760 RepID=UPI0020A7D582|nr:type I glyceraldehyde-3-phosphate dehydrogenase [Myxococcus guangdongensis]MCP3065572.1 type I glyceraldehyde-3-phosphate dehydrogenase [Myxococcus guangdongensis]